MPGRLPLKGHRVQSRCLVSVSLPLSPSLVYRSALSDSSQFDNNTRSEPFNLCPEHIQSMHEYIQVTYASWSEEISAVRGAQSNLFKDHEPKLCLIVYGQDQPMPLNHDSALIRSVLLYSTFLCYKLIKSKLS